MLQLLNPKETIMDAEIKQYIIEELGIDDAELVQGVFDEYCQVLINSLGEMTALLHNGNYVQFQKTAHKIKGAALTVGHSATHQIVVHLEEAARNADRNACRAGLDQLKDIIISL